MLRLASCIVFQRPKDKKILFVKRKESDLWGLPGGKLEPNELHYIQWFSYAWRCKKPNIEYSIISDAIELLMYDEITLAGFMCAAIRESKEEVGLVPSSMKATAPFPHTLYSVKPIYCGSVKDPVTKQNDFFTMTFYCSEFVGKTISLENLELRWEDKEFLISSEIFVPEYNKHIFQFLKDSK